MALESPNRLMDEPVTMTDVAKATGYSVASVGYAYTGKGRMPVETRERIRRVGDRLGYVHPLRLPKKPHGWLPPAFACIHGQEGGCVDCLNFTSDLKRSIQGLRLAKNGTEQGGASRG